MWHACDASNCNLIDQPILPKQTHERQEAQQRWATQKAVTLTLTLILSLNPKSKTTSSPSSYFLAILLLSLSTVCLVYVSHAGLCCGVFGGFLCVCHISQPYTACFMCFSGLYCVHVFCVSQAYNYLAPFPGPFWKIRESQIFQMGLGTRLIATVHVSCVSVTFVSCFCDH